MKSKYGNDYFIAISKPIFLEIANKNINKGKTLRKLGELTGIKMEEMIAVGDSYNDIPLLEVVGMPVAVANANDEIKAMSKFESTSNNDDALKTVIEKFF
jgi:phosphatase yidA